MAAMQLAHASCATEIIAVVSGAIYLRNDEGQILWLSHNGSALHRRAILAPLPIPGWRVGAACCAEGDFLCVEGGERVEWRNAPVWHAPTPQANAVPMGRSRLALRVALSALCQTQTPLGFARYAAARCGCAFDLAGTSSSDFSARWMEEGEEPVARALDACSVHDTAGLLAAGDRLIGLGEGLTPSGDDFLGGLLFASRYVEGAHCQVSQLDWETISGWLRESEARTNAISFSILSDLACGHGPEPLHELVCEVLAGAYPHRITQRAARLVQIGRTSGWDMLAGVAAAMGEFPFYEIDESRQHAMLGPCAGHPARTATGEWIPARGTHGD